MEKIEFGGPGEIKQTQVHCTQDAMENEVKKFGVVYMCEWFGHSSDSDMTRDTIKYLIDRSNSE